MSEILTASRTQYTESVRSTANRRKQVYRPLKEQDKYKIVVKALDAGLVYTDAEGIIQEINSQAEELLNVHQSQLLGRSVYDLHPPQIASGIRRIFHDLQSDPYNDVITIERELKGRWVHMRFAALRDEEERLIGVNFILTDATEKKNLQERQKFLESELQQEQKLSAIGMQASGIAHNLNGPLAIIVGYLDLLGSFHPELKEIPLILSQAERMKEIIANMMIKSRHEQDTRRRAVDLNTLLQEELKFLESNLHFKNNVGKQYEFSRDLPPLWGLYSDFSQIFMNLIHNALDAMADAQVKTLKVTTRCDDENVYVDITDTGHGLEPEDVNKIFAPFYTTKLPIGQSQEGRPTGTGLGLPSSVGLTAQYGGCIHVDGRRGEGATFTVVLPIEPNRPGACHAEAERLEPATI